MAVIAKQEAVHNESYSYVLSSVVSLDEQNESFQLGRKDPVLLKRNESVTKQYNAFVEEPSIDKILKTLVYTAILEGMYYYSGFAFFYNLACYNINVGTSSLISHINRNDLYHVQLIAYLY